MIQKNVQFRYTRSANFLEHKGRTKNTKIIKRDEVTTELVINETSSDRQI